MKIRLHALLTALLVVSLVLPALGQDMPKQQKSKKQAAAVEKPKTIDELATQDLTQDQAIMHVLNRLGFGPRPGDVERVREMGIEKYIDGQLNPAKIDDSATEARLKRYTTL